MKYPYLTLALLVFFCVVDIVILGNHFELTKSDWSGWVQAIGSIAALGVAIFVMSRQNRHAAQLLIDADKRALLRRADAVGAVMDRAHTQLPTFCQMINVSIAMSDERLIRACMSTATFGTAELQVAIRAIPAHELGSYEMVSGLYRTIEVLSVFETMVGRWLQDAQLPAPITILAFLTVTNNSCEEAKAIFLRGVDKLRTE